MKKKHLFLKKILISGFLLYFMFFFIPRVLENAIIQKIDVTDFVRSFSDSDLSSLSKYFLLTKISIKDSKINGSGFKSFRYHYKLKGISLTNNEITDEGLKSITNLTQLVSLSLVQEKCITGKGFRLLKNLTNLKKLFFFDIEQKNPDWSTLQHLTNLSELYLSGTNITDQDLVYIKDLKTILWTEIKRLNYRIH